MARVNHAQIAAAAGVSRSTVSRALQNHPALPPSTRQRIQALAKEMGYRPNPLVSALMATRNQVHAATSSSTLAILTAWPPTPELSPLPTDRRYLRGATQRAEELGFHVEFFWTDAPGLSDQRLDQILVSRGIVAVLLAPIPLQHAEIRLKWEHFSLAAFAPSPQIPVLHRASHFHFQSCALAMRRVRELGYRRPGLVVPAKTTAHVRDQWIGSHYASQAGTPGPAPIPPFVEDAPRGETFLGWCQAHRPDVILSNDAAIPAALREATGRLGPVAFANLDRHPDHPETAGIDQMHELVGSSAVDLIVAQVNRNERGVPRYPKDVLTEGKWVDGPSALPL